MLHKAHTYPAVSKTKYRTLHNDSKQLTRILTSYGKKKNTVRKINKQIVGFLYEEAGLALSVGRTEAAIELLETAKSVLRKHMTAAEKAYADA